MGSPNTLMVDDVKYVREDSIPQAKNLSKDVRIVILQRGWVMVGRFSKDGQDCQLQNASVIRIWGTSKGLGQLLSGPISGKTELDPCGTARFNELAIVSTLDCEESKWAQHLK